ncbi:Protein LIPS-7 a, partial [Aphelenchoides avenae]
RAPVIFVHGLTGAAGDLVDVKAYFRVNGFAEEELYGTTYGAYGRTRFFNDSLNCGYVKQLRTFFIAVSEFADSQVNIIGWSMGSALSRKAILGGKCIDTDEELGGPLTSIVRRFISVAGANRGTLFCFTDSYPTCNMEDGMHCDSEYYKDVNSKYHYESESVFSILPTTDEVVGYKPCPGYTNHCPGADHNVTLVGLDHFGAFHLTAPLQYNIIVDGRTTVP